MRKKTSSNQAHALSNTLDLGAGERDPTSVERRRETVSRRERERIDDLRKSRHQKKLRKTDWADPLSTRGRSGAAARTRGGTHVSGDPRPVMETRDWAEGGPLISGVLGRRRSLRHI